MKFKELALQNFGIFKGKHVIDFETDEQKPIILCGGLNGSGKTTILEALQLILFGKNAHCFNHRTQAYSSYLRQKQNKYIDSDSKVSIQLTFIHSEEFEESEYKVDRSWRANEGSNFTDILTVSCNGEIDKHLTSNWESFVNKFIPISLSDLFFFDGEKIEHLADPKRSRELIKTGIENLLGIDLINQLNTDLGLIKNNNQKSLLKQSDISLIENLEAEIASQNEIISSLKDELEMLEEEVVERKDLIIKSRREVRNAGAHLLEKRDDLTFELGSVESKLESIQKEQIVLASGVGPLSLVEDLLNSAIDEIDDDKDANKVQILKEELPNYNKQILNEIKLSKLPVTAKNKVNEILSGLIDKIQLKPGHGKFMRFDKSDFIAVGYEIPLDKFKSLELISTRNDLLEKKYLLENKIQSIPTYEKVKPLLDELTTHEVYLKLCIEKISKKNEELESSIVGLNILMSRHSNQLEKQNLIEFEKKKTAKVVKHIDKVSTVLSSYRDELIQSNLEQLEKLVKLKLDNLNRKDNLIDRIKICQQTFELELFDNHNNQIQSSSLSAGERQLLSIAVLWAFAEASGREIPTIIDTPLGRLDSTHRSNLVRNYFPQASKQVILLSTDEELREEHQSLLSDKISKEYLISFDNEINSSIIEERYF